MTLVQSLPPNLDGPLDTVVVLPEGFSGAEVARVCRETAVQFMNESARWGKPELAMWLAGPYAIATRHVKKEEGPNLLGGTPLIKEIDIRVVDRVIRAARTEVHQALAQVCADQSSAFVLRALIAGTVTRCEDGLREPAWAPVRGASMRLADRVLSLFAVDYLVRPGDYETDLSICASCSSITFDAYARRRDYCSLHAPQPARKGLTVPYPGLPQLEA
ncbi:MAG: hypothetical protein KIT84_08050 [Labilithrix sp.]|nr:hypothetical protein [Labilithrix sp.]MCW5810950.1 hypothetical protein [Labilithrix sp.]